MTMLPEIGRQVSGAPRNLHVERHLEYFEGPILTEYRTDEGGISYIEKWCTQTEDGGFHRFLLVRSDLRSIAQYMAQRLSMLSLLVGGTDGIGFLIDRSKHGAQVVDVRVALIVFDDLPEDYLPEPDAYHDESLRPNSSRTIQSFLLGPEWSGEQISSIERSYLDAAAFNYFTAANTNATTGIPENVLRFRYRRGYPVRTAFSTMRANTPHSERGRSAGVAAGSPGVLSIDVGSKLAENLRESISRLEASKPLYDLVQEWAKQDITKDPQIPDNAIDRLGWLADSLGLDLARFGDVQGRTHEIGKLLTAYFRKLTKLARPPGAEFLGADPVSVPLELDLFSYDDDDE